MASFDDLDDTPLDDDDPFEVAAEADATRDALAGRIAEILSDPQAGDGTIRLLEDYDQQLVERGWLSEKQVETIARIENRRFGGRERF